MKTPKRESEHRWCPVGETRDYQPTLSAKERARNPRARALKCRSFLHFKERPIFRAFLHCAANQKENPTHEQQPHLS